MASCDVSLEQCSKHLLVHSGLTGSESTLTRKIQRKGKRRIKKTHTYNCDHILTLVSYTVFVFCFLGGLVGLFSLRETAP